MSDPEFFKVKYKLTEQISREGGMTMALANERAGREMKALEGKSREAVGATIDALEQLAKERTAPMDAVYDLATNVLDVAGLYNQRLLCEATYSLCELTDRLRSQSKVDWAPIVVHVDALKHIFAAPPHTHETLVSLVKGLWTLVEYIKEADAPPAP